MPHPKLPRVKKGESPLKSGGKEVWNPHDLAKQARRARNGCKCVGNKRDKNCKADHLD